MFKKVYVIFGITGILFLFGANNGFIKGEISSFIPRPYENSTWLNLGCGLRFDTRYGEPSIPQDLKIKDYEGEDGIYIVQFKGPIYSHYRDFLNSIGVKIYLYIPNYAYLVHAKKEDIPKIKEQPFVNWVGIYQPYYKIAPTLNLSTSQIDTFIIVGYPDMDIKPVIEKIEKLQGRVIEKYHSKWNHLLKVEISSQELIEIVKEKAVRWVEEFEMPRLLNDRAQWVIQTWEEDNRRIWDMGIKGEGQIGAVLDSGVRTSHDMFRDPDVPIDDFGDYPNHRKIIAYQKPAYDPQGVITFGDEPCYGFYHGTHTSCSVLGSDDPVGGTSAYDGMAPEAKLYFLDGGSSSYPCGIIHAVSLEYSLSVAYKGNEAGGARVISNSWGKQTGGPGTYDHDCMEADMTVWDYPDYGVFFAAGNTDAGPYTGSPANAKNVVAVGATLNGTAATSLAGFTTRGPTADGRIKPDIVVPGVLTSAYGGNDDGYTSGSGTSMSCPAAAGNALLIRQYFTDGYYPSGEKGGLLDAFNPSAALIKAMLINSVELDVSGISIPDNRAGWGRPKLDNVLYFSGDSRKLRVVDFKEGLKTGYAFSAEINVESDAEPFRVTLVWTDYPASEYANPALVNDLNLEVISPSEEHYLGNVFENNQSVPGGDPDSKNPVENVFIDTPESGTWKIVIKAENIPFGPQPFALVVTGALSEEGMKSVVVEDIIIDDAGEENPDGNWDPGESVTMKVKLKNLGDVDLNNVNATISTTTSYVSISKSEASYGNIPQGGSSMGDGFEVTASPDTPEQTWAEFTMNIEASNFSTVLTFKIMIGLPRYSFADHNIGNVILTVTEHGSIGFLGINQQGTGFKYPKTSQNWLYHASFAAGNAKDYVCDRFYPNTPDNKGNTDWNVTKAPDGRVIFRRIVSDQDSKAMFEDSGHPNSKGLLVEQYGYAWSDPEYNDFVILRYKIRNKGSQNISGLYVGIIADFDMEDAQSNEGGTDKGTQLAYMKITGKDTCVGVCLLEPSYRNLSMLENPVYVYQGANNVWNDSTLYKFLKGDISVPQSDKSTDWSVVVSAGPFDLSPEDSTLVAFAFVGGDNPDDVIQNAAAAKELHDNTDFRPSEEGPGVEEELSIGTPFRITYNNFSKEDVIFNVSLSAKTSLTVEIYDISGRKINTLYHGKAFGKMQIRWDRTDRSGNRASAGIYFIRFRTQKETKVIKLLLID